MKNLYRRILKTNKYHLIERCRVLAYTKRTGDRYAFNHIISEKF